MTFPTGVTTQTIAVTIVGDRTFEPNEDFLVELFGPSPDVTIAVFQARGTIVNDDSQPTIAISDPSVTEGDAGNILGFTVSLSNPSSQPITVSYQTAPGTATSGVDYTDTTSGTSCSAPVKPSVRSPSPSSAMSCRS